MRSSLAAYVSPFILAATLVNSAITPTSPGGGKEVFVAGQECSFEWEADATGVSPFPFADSDASLTQTIFHSLRSRPGSLSMST